MIIFYKSIDKIQQAVYTTYNLINFIKSDGGTGPMKSGNLI